MSKTLISRTLWKAASATLTSCILEEVKRNYKENIVTGFMLRNNGLQRNPGKNVPRHLIRITHHYFKLALATV